MACQTRLSLNLPWFYCGHFLVVVLTGALFHAYGKKPFFHLFQNMQQKINLSLFITEVSACYLMYINCTVFLNHPLVAYLDNVDFLTEEEKRFRKHRSCEDHAFVLLVAVWIKTNLPLLHS